MSGILNNKSRIFDTIVTQEGRRQIASGKLRAEFFSFSDSGVFYNQDTISGSDAGWRISLEAASLPQDQVAFEADDSGRLVPFRGSSVQLSNGKIVTYVTGISGAVRDEVVDLSNSAFASASSNLLSSSFANFNKLYIIGSPDIFNEDRNEFLISRNQLNFTITNDRPIGLNQIKTTNVNHVESFYQDKRLSHVPNFFYLPPVNKAKLGTKEHTPLGYYARVNQPDFDYDSLKFELSNLKTIGFEQSVEFTETSAENNLMCQFFELANGSVSKLEVIDFGLFHGVNNKLTEEELEEAGRSGREIENESSTKHVFFAGKVFVDDHDSHTFINLFTIVFEG